MALTTEDGSIVAGADSYITLVDARTLAANYGLTLNTDDTVAETQLRQAYSWITTYYERRLQGDRISAAQTGALPREYMYAHRYLIPSNAIPDAFKMAQVKIAAGVEAGIDLNQVKTSADLKSFNVQGVYSEEYQDGQSTVTRAQFASVSDLLYPYTKAAVGGGGVYRENVGYL